jgi:hypothetical protein
MYQNTEVLSCSWLVMRRDLWVKVKFLFLAPSITHFPFVRIPSTKQNNRNKLKDNGYILWTFLMVRVKMDLSRANQASVFCVTFFGLEFWPNYTELHCLVFNACDGKHVYIVFFYFIIYFCIFYWFWKERWTLFTYSGLIGFDNGGEKVFGAFSSALCIELNSIIIIISYWFHIFL